MVMLDQMRQAPNRFGGKERFAQHLRQQKEYIRRYDNLNSLCKSHPENKIEVIDRCQKLMASF